MYFFTSLRQFSDFALLLLRLGVGVIFIVHGIQKRALWKMEPSAQMSPRMLNLMRFLSIAETLGGVAVLVGFLTPLASLGFAVIMVGAIWLKVKTWGRKFTGDGGWELDFIILAAVLALAFLGAGSLSFDGVLFQI